jgi:hypothetical protein
MMRRSALDRDRGTHAAADAQRRQRFLRIATLHLVQQGDHDTATPHSDRMADRDRAAVYVDLCVSLCIFLFTARLGGLLLHAFSMTYRPGAGCACT